MGREQTLAAAPADWRLLALYGAPALGAAAPALLVQFYFLSFSTDVLLLAPASVGLLLAAGRLWDAFTDPLTGFLSDRTRTRLGRRRPWLLAAAPGTALAFIALWNPPASAAPAQLLVWCGVSLFALSAAVTAWTIPHQALGMEVASTPVLRTRIYAARHAASLLGAALGFGTMQVIVTAADPRVAAGELAWLGGLAILVLLLVPGLFLREPAPAGDQPEAPGWSAWRAVARSPFALRVLFVWFATQLAGAAQGMLAPYVAKYVLHRPEWTGLLAAFYIVPLVLSIPFWVRAARSLGPVRVWRGSLICCALSYLSLLALEPDALLRAGLLLAAAGFFTGASGPIGPTLLAAAVDEEASVSGQAKSGVFFAAKEFVEKAGGAAVAVVVGISLQLSGFEPNVQQGAATLWVIRLCLAALPALLLVLAATVLREPHGAAAFAAERRTRSSRRG